MKLPQKDTLLVIVLLGFMFAGGCYLYRMVFLPLRHSAEPQVIETLKNAHSVEVFRVAPEQSLGAKETISGFPVLGNGEKQGREFAERLAKVLLSNGVLVNQKKCGMSPGVAFRVSYDDSTVDVLVCFECDVLACVKQGAAVDASDYQDFDSVRGSLLALAKESLPHDEEIQALLSERSY